MVQALWNEGPLVPMAAGAESSKTELAEAREPSETHAPRADAMIASQAWDFTPKLDAWKSQLEGRASVHPAPLL